MSNLKINEEKKQFDLSTYEEFINRKSNDEQFGFKEEETGWEFSITSKAFGKYSDKVSRETLPAKDFSEDLLKEQASINKLIG